MSPEEQRQANNPWSNAPAGDQFLGTPGNSQKEQGYTPGQVYDPGSWGGSAGTVTRDPVTGEIKVDTSQNGARADVSRYQGMAQAAAGRTGPQINYGVADTFAGLGGQMRGEQDTAIGLARDRANGVNSQSQALGQQMIGQGAAAQQSVAMSRRGGPLSVASARAGQASGEAAFRQGANTRLAAVLAREQAEGRKQYMGATLGQRQGDLTAQGLNQQQGIAQGQMDRGQRELNAQAELGYEGMGADTNQAQAKAQTERYAGAIGAAQQENAINNQERQTNRKFAESTSNSVMSDTRTKNIADWY